MMLASCAGEHGVEPPLHPRNAVPRTSATLPPVAPIAICGATVKNGPGIEAPFAPLASSTRKYWPGASVASGSRVIPDDPNKPVPVALVYCSDSPLRETGAAPRL